MKKFYIIFTSLFLLLFISFGAKAALLNDTSNLDPAGGANSQTGDFVTGAGFETSTSVGSLTATIILAFLGLLGIIFIIILVWAGYKYMTARGNEDKIEESLAMIRRAIIGLIIVMAAYSITYFVFSKLDRGSNATSTTSIGGNIS